MQEKRRLLDFVLSNSTWKDGKLTPKYRKPFDLMMVANDAYQKEKAAGRASNGFSDIWLPFLDSLRNELTAPSGEILSMLAAIQDVDFPCRWQYFARNCIL